MQQKSPGSSKSERRGVRRVRIDENSADQRIDNFLRRELPGVPKSRIYRILRKGEVRVNGGRVIYVDRRRPGYGKSRQEEQRGR